MLIELLGLTGALLVGAACSGTAGVIALLLDRRIARRAGPEPEEAPIGVPAASASPGARERDGRLALTDGSRWPSRSSRG